MTVTFLRRTCWSPQLREVKAIAFQNPTLVYILLQNDQGLTVSGP